jgi:hypothetical protein
MILRLPHSLQDYPAVSTTAQLADLLGTELIGTYFEDSSLLELAKLPDAREFRFGEWKPLTAEQLALESEETARAAQRLFSEIADRHRTTTLFSKEKGSAAVAIAAQAGADDIIAIIEPKSPIERATYQFTELVEAAFRTTCSILVIPSLPVLLSGPIVALAATADDPSIGVALAAAASAREQVIIAPLQHSALSFQPIAEKARLAGVRATLLEPQPGGLDTILPSLIKGRLVVKRRQASERRPFSTLPFPMPTLLVSVPTI